MPRNINKIIDRQLHQWDRVAAKLGYEPAKRADAAPTQAEVARQPVICFSRQLGVGTGEIVNHLAEELEYEIFGRDIIDHIARDMNVQRRIIDVRDEHLRSSIELMVEGMLSGRHIDDRDYFGALVRVVEGIARKGGVIFLGRGSTQILGERAALRVRLTAPREARIRHLVEVHGQTEAEAKRRIEKSDEEREQFIRHHFRMSIDDVSAHDIALNTARFSRESCVKLILEALEARGIEIQRLGRG